MARKKASASGKGAKSTADAVDFEASLAKVQQIVAKLEGGELGLTESLEQYEAGIKELKRCHAILEAAEQKVSLLSGFDADGNPITEPMTDTTGRTGARGGAGGSEDDDRVDDGPGLF